MLSGVDKEVAGMTVGGGGGGEEEEDLVTNTKQLFKGATITPAQER